MNKITPTQVRRAQEAADRAALAVERHQQKTGYGRGCGRTRELRCKAQLLSTKAYQMKYDFAQQANPTTQGA